ncbi:hypothetical protein OSTOST_01056 [Ostertagia ostertagi]
MCSSTCAGLACGCLTPFPGCLFYRVAQVPKNEAIYHIFKCASWNPEIHILLETTLTGTTTSNPLAAPPIHGWDVKVTSLQHIIHAALSKRFAESAAGFKMLGDAFKIAVECPDENTARKHFANCSNEVVCSCSHTMAAAQCVCPQNSFQEPQNSTTNLPAIEPHLNITASETVMIDTDDTEGATTARKEQKPQCTVARIHPANNTGMHRPNIPHQLLKADTATDISPFLGTITKHWKTTAAVIGGLAVIGLLIYVFGPSIIIAIIRILTNIILALPRSLLECTTKTKNKIFHLENKIDTILTNTTPRHPCIFCEGDNEDGHRSSACSVFPDPIARSFRLRDLNRCISCLAPAHGQCSNKCRGCGGTHHAILCTERSKQGPPQKRQRLEH